LGTNPQPNAYQFNKQKWYKYDLLGSKTSVPNFLPKTTWNKLKIRFFCWVTEKRSTELLMDKILHHQG